MTRFMTMIWKWIQKTNYNEAFVFNGNRTDLHELLNRLNTVRIRMVNDDEIKVLAIVSLGISTGALPTQSVNITMLVKDLNPDQLQINILTKTRFEQYLLVPVFILILFSIISEGGKLWQFFLALALWPVTHWWFHLWHRAQENDLYNLMVKKLRLQELSTS
jgi:hypothetical protein